MYVRIIVAFTFVVFGIKAHGDDAPSPTHIVPRVGGVYLTENGVVRTEIASLLSESALSATAGWVENKELESNFSAKLATARRQECLNGRWCIREWSVELVGEKGVVQSVEGVQELPEILNRPLTGDLSLRTEELRIAQLQRTISTAIASTEPGSEAVAACVSVITLENPKLLLKGYSSLKSASAMAEIYASRLKCKVDGVESDDAEGVFSASLNGLVLAEVRLRLLLDGEPRFGSDRLFYLGNEAKSVVRVDSDVPSLSMP